jgi:hypothetical protein
MDELTTGPPAPRGGVTRRLSLNNIGATRKAIARVARAFWNGSLDGDKARTMGYLLSLLVNAWKTETELEIARRLDELERKLEERGKA